MCVSGFNMCDTKQTNFIFCSDKRDRGSVIYFVPASYSFHQKNENKRKYNNTTNDIL